MAKFYGHKNNSIEEAMKNCNENKIVISLYDYTGEALKPWAEVGYQCIAYDIQHDIPHYEQFEGGGRIDYRYADLHSIATLDAIYDSLWGKQVTFAMAFPVCTDMAVSGAAHFKRKRERDPLFQRKAANYAIWCAELFKHSTAHTL